MISIVIAIITLDIAMLHLYHYLCGLPEKCILLQTAIVQKRVFLDSIADSVFVKIG